MDFFRSPRASTYGFLFANLVLVLIIYHRTEDPLQFFLMGGGVVVFSFFLKRAIDQAIGI